MSNVIVHLNQTTNGGPHIACGAGRVRGVVVNKHVAWTRVISFVTCKRCRR